MATAGDEILGARLIELIGRGPNGAVWTARDSDERTVAVKLFDPGPGASAHAEATFKRGVQTLTQAVALDVRRDCALPRVYSVADDELAFVFDYFDNGSVAGIPALHWDVPRTLEFFGRVCRAVAELHELGITHRALKPSNVLVDDQLLPVLTDPGMVGPRDPNRQPSGHDLIYRAPEESGGEGIESPNTDVYGLGTLLWFLLLGADPDEPYQTFATLASLSKFPPGLVRIVRKATAHDPAARYQWVQELEADLARYNQVELVGIGQVGQGDVYPKHAVSSLPARPLRRKPEGAPVRAALRTRETEQGGGRFPTREIGAVGLGVVVLGCVYLLVASAPHPSFAKIFGFAAPLGLALATFLFKPFPSRPVLGRVLVFGAVFALFLLLGLDRLAVARWKYTLERGSDAARANAARFLAGRGHGNLRGTQLAGVDLTHADLGTADLAKADLKLANLSGANLVQSNLAGADVRGANLRGADLFFSNVSEANGWLEAHCDSHTVMPRGWTCNGGHPKSPRH